jgi:hypothetical protein
MAESSSTTVPSTTPHFSEVVITQPNPVQMFCPVYLLQFFSVVSCSLLQSIAGFCSVFPQRARNLTYGPLSLPPPPPPPLPF